MEPAKDILFPSDNLYDIPCLRLDRQAGHLELPFVPYGTGRRNRRVATLHFYVDDYRFNALWKKKGAGECARAHGNLRFFSRIRIAAFRPIVDCF